MATKRIGPSTGKALTHAQSPDDRGFVPWRLPEPNGGHHDVESPMRRVNTGHDVRGSVLELPKRSARPDDRESDPGPRDVRRSAVRKEGAEVRGQDVVPRADVDVAEILLE